MSDIRELARGKWAGLLGRYLDERALSGKHSACPICKAGKDRFRLDDKDGAGTYICSNCGSGDGFMLLEQINGWEFKEAAQYVKGMVGTIQAKAVTHTTDPDQARASLKRVWDGAKQVEAGDPVSKYLERRCGRAVAPSGIRCHPSLGYRHEDGTTTKHPAMIAQVRAADGKPVCLHRTYLTEAGEKADVPTVRKLMTPTQRLEKVAIRLAAPVDGWLGVSEGVETALCASIRFQVPVWACVSAGLLKSFRPPEGVTLLFVMGDNDATYTGQAAAYEMARAVAMSGVETRVHIPDDQNTDWAD